MKEVYLPIGSIVILDNNSKVMINGYFSSDKKNVTYEYSGVSYPEGMINSNKGVLFNHKSIKNIIYLGLEDEEYIEFSKRIMKISKEYTSIMFGVTTKALSNYLGGVKNE